MRHIVFCALLILPLTAGASQGFRLDGTIAEDNSLLGGGTVTGNVKFEDDTQLQFGDSSDTQCEYDTAVTPDAMVCGLGADSRVWYFAEAADLGTDWAKAQQTNPTLCVQSADAASTTDRLCLTHDQTNAVLSSDSGDVHIVSAGNDVLLTDAAGTDFTRLQFGCAGAGCPAIAKNPGPSLMATKADGTVTVPFYASAFLVSGSGTGYFRVNADDSYRFLGRSRIKSPVSGNILLVDFPETGFNLLQFGGSGAGNPAIGPDPTDTDAVAVRLADDSAYTGVYADFYSSDAADPADTGAIRLGNTECIAWELATPGADKELCVDASDNLTYASENVTTATGTPVDGQLGVWTDADTLEGDSDLTWDTSTDDFLIGNPTISGVANPVMLSLGGTYGSNHPSTDDSALKLAVFESATQFMGFGVSPSQFNFMMSTTTYDFYWYVDGNALMALDGTTGVLSFGGAGASFPAIRREPASDDLGVVLADGSAYTALKARELIYETKITGDAGAEIRWSGRTTFDSPSDGGMRFRNAAKTVGACADVGTDNVWRFEERNCTSVAQVIGRFEVIQNAAPAEPVACSSSTIGYRVMVDDTDDTVGTEVCVCGMTDDTTYDWLDVSDNTACTFF